MRVQIASTMYKMPAVFLRDAARDLLPTYEYLRSLGLADDDLTGILRACASLAGSAWRHLVAVNRHQQDCFAASSSPTLMSPGWAEDRRGSFLSHSPCMLTLFARKLHSFSNAWVKLLVLGRDNQCQCLGGMALVEPL